MLKKENPSWLSRVKEKLFKSRVKEEKVKFSEQKTKAQRGQSPIKQTKPIPQKHPKYIFIILFIVLILAFLALDIALSKKKIEKIPTCGDGTFYDTCSLDKPYYCDNGVLMENASTCGCPNFLRKEGDFCVLTYGMHPKEIVLKYILDKQEKEINFRIYNEVNTYVSNIPRIIDYSGLEIPFRADFKIKSVNEEVQREMILPLVKKIQNLAPNNKIQQARIAINIVQNIPYGFSEKTLLFAGQEINYSRYPYEVLDENQGICGEKSTLLSFLLREIGYGVSIFYFAEENHEAVGIKCPVDKSFYGSGYCFAETNRPSIITDSSIVFEGEIKLESEPEILLISRGISLPENMYEYKDAKTLKNIREKNIFGILKFWKFNSLKEKYGLVEVYNLR